jgi:hypothetical protein
MTSQSSETATDVGNNRDKAGGTTIVANVTVGQVSGAGARVTGIEIHTLNLATVS